MLNWNNHKHDILSHMGMRYKIDASPPQKYCLFRMISTMSFSYHTIHLVLLYIHLRSFGM